MLFSQLNMCTRFWYI